MKTLLLSTAIALTSIASADAIQITAFGQTSGSNTVFATDNLAQSQTTITITDAQVGITQLLGVLTPFNADLDLTATSIDPAVTFLGNVVQHYSGSFCIASGPGCTGTDWLSGTFTDAAFGAAGGPGLTVNINNPPESLTMMSSVIPSSELQPPSTLDFSFSNVTPGVGVAGTTIAPFDASFTGDASASNVVEPASLSIFGLAIGALAFARRRNL